MKEKVNEKDYVESINDMLIKIQDKAFIAVIYGMIKKKADKMAE